MDEAMKLVKMILKNAPIAVAYAKKCINDNYDMNIDEALAYENEYFAKCFSTEDQKDGMTAFLAKEKAVFKGK
jgi:enoyl-CoA hydratase